MAGPVGTGRWLARLLLALLLWLGIDVILFLLPADLQQQIPQQWVLYGVVAMIALDVLARYRLRTVFDFMTWALVLAMFLGLLASRERVFDDLPISLLMYGVGGLALVTLEMAAAWLALRAGSRRPWRLGLLAGAAWLGFFWGVWLRWAPEKQPLVFAGPLDPLAGAALIAVGWLLALALVWIIGRGGVVAPADLRMNALEMGGIAIVLVAFVAARATDALAIGIALAIGGISAVVIWYRAQSHDSPGLLLDIASARPLPWAWGLACAAAFFALAFVGYAMPTVSVAGIDQYQLMALGLVGTGFLWIPLIGLGYGLESLRR
jgi:hypothetical protein